MINRAVYCSMVWAGNDGFKSLKLADKIVDEEHGTLLSHEVRNYFRQVQVVNRLVARLRAAHKAGKKHALVHALARFKNAGMSTYGMPSSSKSSASPHCTLVHSAYSCSQPRLPYPCTVTREIRHCTTSRRQCSCNQRERRLQSCRTIRIIHRPLDIIIIIISIPAAVRGSCSTRGRTRSHASAGARAQPAQGAGLIIAELDTHFSSRS